MEGKPRRPVWPLDGAAIQVRRSQRADAVEDVLRNGLAAIDEAGGGVGLQAEGLVGQVGQDAVSRDVSG